MPTGRSTIRRSGNPIPNSLWAPASGCSRSTFYGPTSFASLRPIRTLDDFKGRKIRVLASKMETALVGKLGATGVPMSYIEVLPGLSRKTIDGVRSSIIVMGGSKFFTVTKYITVVESGPDSKRHLRERGVAEETSRRPAQARGGYDERNGR